MSANLHPTVRLLREREAPAPAAVDRERLRALALEAGADDVGFLAVDAAEVADQRSEILSLLPGARTLIALVVRMNKDAIRAPARSVSNLEFHHAGDEANRVARRIARALNELGYRAASAAMGFPMEMNRFPEKIWVIGHKPIAVAAGLGRMGIHRNVIHPRFGNFILLDTVVTDLVVEAEPRPLDFNPCLECKLCVAACPVGAIAPDGRFDFSACQTHNYREFMGGFTDWVGQIAESGSARGYRARVSDAESSSMWQSLSFGANYKAAYCMAVCPAGEEVIAPYLQSRAGFLKEVVHPLQQKQELVYVTPGSDAEAHVLKRFPHKTVRHAASGLRATNVRSFAFGLSLRFQRGGSAGLAARYHFVFTGRETAELTVDIRDQRLQVERGLVGEPDLQVVADTATWLGFLAKERSLFWALLTRRIRVRGPLRLLAAFGRCFG